MHQDLDRILYRESEIREAIELIAAEITEAYAGRPLTVVPVLKGSILFAADLIRRLPIPLELAFVAASSYGVETSPGELRVDLFPAEGELEGREVLLIDDILDTGRTLARLLEEVRRRGARDVRTCVFLDKPARRTIELVPDWSCFEVEDTFVVGYGLDLAGRYRNLPFVAALKPEVQQAYASPSTPGGGGATGP